MIHRAQQQKQRFPARFVAAHLDFLPDDALLLLHGRLGKIRVRDEIQQDFQRIRQIVGTRKQIAGFVKRGVGVGVGTRFGVALERVQVLAFKQFVLQKVGNALGHACKCFFARQTEIRIHRAVLRAEHRIRRGVILFRIHQNFQPRRVINIIIKLL